MKVLFLGANALDTSRLRIPAELRDVKEEIERAANRKDIDFRAELAVRPTDLSRLLLDDRPDIVHFSGHGMELRVHTAATNGPTREFDAPEKPDETPENKPAESAILLENSAGKAVPVPPDALTSLFGILKSQRCLVLNACFSSAQAQTIAKHVDCVIGMKRAIGDESAIVFASGFYQALARGSSVKEAFELGKNLIAICSLPDAEVPELFTKDGVDADTVRFISDAGKSPPSGPKESKPPATKSPSAQAKPLPKSLVRSLLGILAVLVIAGGGFLAAPVRLPSIAPANGTIVVVGPGALRFGGQRAAESLCAALDNVAHDGEPRAVCRRQGFGDNDEKVRDKALQAGASVLVIVDDLALARMYPLGGLATHDRLARGWPSVDLTKSGTPNAFAPLLHELARAADGAKDATYDKTRLRCGESVAQEPFGVALVTMVLRLYAPNCLSVQEDVDVLRPRCRGEECQILDLLVTKPKPLPPDCDREPDAGKQLLCMQKQAIHACETNEKDVAQSWIGKFDAVPSPFFSVMASVTATCMIAHANGLSSDQKTLLEARADKAEPDCDAPACNATEGQCMFCAFVISERARYWAKARNWKNSQRDYERAFRTSGNNEHLMGMIEARLQRFKEFTGEEVAKKTAQDLKAMSNATVEQKIRARLLSWVATKREGNVTYVGAAEDAIVKAYGELPEGKSVYEQENHDEAERSLVCLRNAKACPVYDLLAVPKEAGTADKLREALRQAALPQE